ncbi:MAG: DUF2911 domain-containing protein [Cyclobacteriaceae bacterium]|nr:DUF2911 domain-containing protein [Cyclobacteriaceae bacterium]
MRFIYVVLTMVMMAACSGDKRPAQELTTPAGTAPKDDFVVIGDQPGPDSLKGSLRAKAEGNIGSTKISVRYHSPAVRGRIIWGGLVPLDQVWVTGAHMATRVEFSENVSVDGKPVPAGAYALFSFPGKDTWTLVLNSNWQQHLADEYDQSLDMIRISVKPLKRDVLQERLQYSIVQETPTQGKLVVRWEYVEVALPVTVMP